MRISDWSSDVCSSDLRHEKIPYAVRFRALLQFLDYRQSLPPLSTSLLRGIGLIMGPNHIVHEITDPITPHGFRGRHREIHIAVLIWRSEEHTSELQSLMRISYAVFCLKKKNTILKYHSY